MNYSIIKEIIGLLEQFENENEFKKYSADSDGFKKWIYESWKSEKREVEEPYWEGKENGRSPESAISTLIVHLNKYAKTYSKSAITNSDFTTQDDFIYLINLKSFGSMTKMDLITKNIHTKSAGTVIISRLLKNSWITITDSQDDRRNKIVSITEKGLSALEFHMKKIREATHIVAGDLTYEEKMNLIYILNKLDRFHYPIYSRHINSNELIDVVSREYQFITN